MTETVKTRTLLTYKKYEFWDKIQKGIPENTPIETGTHQSDCLKSYIDYKLKYLVESIQVNSSLWSSLYNDLLEIEAIITGSEFIRHEEPIPKIRHEDVKPFTCPCIRSGNLNDCQNAKYCIKNRAKYFNTNCPAFKRKAR